MRSIFVLAFKDLRLLWRDRFGFFWVIGFPLLFAVFFGSIFSGSGGSAGNMSIAIIDRDNTELSQKFVEKLGNIDVLDVYDYPYDSAFNKVRRGNLVAMIVLKEGFGDQTLFSFSDSAYLQMGIDPSRRAEAGYLNGLVTQAYFQTHFEIFSNPNRMIPQIEKQIGALGHVDTGQDAGYFGSVKKFLGDLKGFYGDMDTLAKAKVKDTGQAGLMTGDMMEVNIDKIDIARERTGPRSAFEIVFPSAVLWGLLACAAAFAITIVQERQGGTYTRLRLAPISRVHILAGKGAACFMACVSVSIFIMILGNIIFGVGIDSILMLVLAILSSALCFVGIMMFVSVLGKTEQAVAGSGWAILLIMGMIGGLMIPLIAMPSWMKSISNFSPMKWGVVAIEGAIWRGFSFTEMLTPIVVLLSFGLVFFVIGATIFTRRD